MGYLKGGETHESAIGTKWNEANTQGDVYKHKECDGAKFKANFIMCELKKFKTIIGHTLWTPIVLIFYKKVSFNWKSQLGLLIN
jgi:hypothetical protein